MNITVGIVQILNGIWGLARSFHFGMCSASDIGFEASVFAGWIIQFTLQILTPIGYLPEGEQSADVSGFTAFSVGLSLIPLYLD